MHIAGPFLDPQRRKSPKKWLLRYFAAELNPDGSPKLNADGKPVKKKYRPYYETKEAAEADKPRLAAQFATAGAGSGGVLTRDEIAEYEAAKREVPEVPLLELARFWRLHHPRNATARIRELTPAFLEWIKARLGETRHYEDLKSRIGPVSDRSSGELRDTPFLARFGERLPATVTREEFLAWLLTLGKAGRTVLNQKRAVVNFFNYLVDVAKVLPRNQLAGIKKRALPKAIKKEIAFLSLVDANRYLRALERYDRELVAHELIQLLAGVRADDEMSDFRGEWVLPQTREIVIPAEIAKTERREVINNLEPAFWEWWRHYGPTAAGLLRPRNYLQRWHRIRALAGVADRAQADELARLPIKTLLARSESKAAMRAWPWNARRRTFCTYKVAKDQSAAAAALILRHRGDAETLHNSYRGTGVTQEQGAAYFAIQPNPVAREISPARPARGIIRLQLERARPTGTAPAASVA